MFDLTPLFIINLRLLSFIMRTFFINFGGSEKRKTVLKHLTLQIRIFNRKIMADNIESVIVQVQSNYFFTEKDWQDIIAEIETLP